MDGDRKARWNADKTVTVLENHTLRKHKPIMLLSVMPFFPFVLGCFGGIGSLVARFLCTLAFLELRQHDALRLS